MSVAIENTIQATLQQLASRRRGTEQGILAPIPLEDRQDDKSGREQSESGDVGKIKPNSHLKLQFKPNLSERLLHLLASAINRNPQAKILLLQLIKGNELSSSELKTMAVLIARAANKGHQIAIDLLKDLSNEIPLQLRQTVLHSIRETFTKEGSFKALRDWKQSEKQLSQPNNSATQRSEEKPSVSKLPVPRPR